MNAIRSTPMLTLAAAACMATTAMAQDDTAPDRIIIDQTLNRQHGRLLSIGPNSLTTIDQAGETQTLHFDQILAIAPAGPWTNPAPQRLATLGRGGVASRPGRLQLIDGQILAGAASVARVDDESVAWIHPALGIVRAPIERIERIIMPRVMPLSAQTPPLDPQEVDVVRLINGDTLQGFINRIGADTSIELESGSTLSIPTGSIDQLTLANEHAPPAGTMIWFDDGSVIAINALTPIDKPASNQIRCILDANSFQSPFDNNPPSEANSPSQPPEFEIELSRITAISFDAQRLIPLASITPTTEGRDIIIDHSSPAILNARPIELPGPMYSAWDLPQGTRAIAMVAELPLEARAWGNLNLIISIDNKERREIHLSASNPQASIRLDTPNARSLEISLEQGPFGPIQNRVVLRQAVVSVDR